MVFVWQKLINQVWWEILEIGFQWISSQRRSFLSQDRPSWLAADVLGDPLEDFGWRWQYLFLTTFIQLQTKHSTHKENLKLGSLSKKRGSDFTNPVLMKDRGVFLCSLWGTEASAILSEQEEEDCSSQSLSRGARHAWFCSLGIRSHRSRRRLDHATLLEMLLCLWQSLI